MSRPSAASRIARAMLDCGNGPVPRLMCPNNGLKHPRMKEGYMNVCRACEYRNSHWMYCRASGLWVGARYGAFVLRFRVVHGLATGGTSQSGPRQRSVSEHSIR